MRVFTALPLHPWRDAAPFAAAAEAAGFDGLSIVELGHDPFAPLALAALATRTCLLTTSVAVAFPRSPTIGKPSLGSVGELQRQVCSWPRQSGQGPQRAPLRRCMECPGAAIARLYRGAARDLAVLGDR